MGGECNYLLRVEGGPGKRLALVPDAAWKSPAMMAWSQEGINALLDAAEAVLAESAAHLRLPVEVGLETLVLPSQHALSRLRMTGVFLKRRSPVAAS